MSTGHLHLDGFKSCFFFDQYKRGRQRLPLLYWYGRQDLNLHGNPLEPKSNVSANSTTPAFIKLFPVLGCWRAGICVCQFLRLRYSVPSLATVRLPRSPIAAHTVPVLHLPQAAHRLVATPAYFVLPAYSTTDNGACQPKGRADESLCGIHKIA